MAWRCACAISCKLCVVEAVEVVYDPARFFSLRTGPAQSCGWPGRSRIWTVRLTWCPEAWINSRLVGSMDPGEIPSYPWQTGCFWDMRITSWGRRYPATPLSSQIPSPLGGCCVLGMMMRRSSCGACSSIGWFIARPCCPSRRMAPAQPPWTTWACRPTAPPTETKAWRSAETAPCRETITTTRHRDANWWTGKTDFNFSAAT